MKTLIKTTRGFAVKILDELAPDNRRTTTYAEWRNIGQKKLKLLNFYQDAFCVEAIFVFEHCVRQNEQMNGLRERAERDLEMLSKWPQMPFDEVLRDFVKRVGWKSSDVAEDKQFALNF